MQGLSAMIVYRHIVQGIPNQLDDMHYKACVLHFTACITTQLFYIQCVLYNAIILHPVCSLALPGYSVLYNAGSAGLQQQD